MARIGEILLEYGWVDATSLQRALAEQSLTGGRRICSLLIARGLLDPDHAARALGELHGVPAVLQRHLEHRDRSLESLLTPTFARAYFALPIGKTRSGEVIICARDPSDEVKTALERVITQPLVLAVAPALQLEQLIDASYEAVDEFDVDLSTGTNIERPDGLEDPDQGNIGEFSLADLDDVRVTKQEVKYEVQRTTPPPFASVTPPDGYNPPTTPPRRPFGDGVASLSTQTSNVFGDGRRPSGGSLPPANSPSRPDGPFASVTPPEGFNPPTNRPSSPFASLTPPEGYNPPTNRPTSPFASVPTDSTRPRTAGPLAAAEPPPETEYDPSDDIELPDLLPPVDGRNRSAPPSGAFGALSTAPQPTRPPPMRPPTAPPPLGRPTMPPPRPPSAPPTAIGTEPPNRPKVVIPPIGAPLPRQPVKTPTGPQPAVRLSLDDVAKALREAVTRDLATDVVMRYVTQRWTSSLLLAVKEGAALGHRGHGPQLTPVTIRAVAIPLTTPSIVKAAHDDNELVTTAPRGSGAIQERLVRLLGDPKSAIAAPVHIDGRPGCVLVVGDPVNGGNSATDLDRLSELLGEAYTRILRYMK